MPEGLVKPVKDLLEHQEIHCVDQKNTVFDAAQRMAGWGIGALTVLDGERLVGAHGEFPEEALIEPRLADLFEESACVVRGASVGLVR